MLGADNTEEGKTAKFQQHFFTPYKNKALITLLCNNIYSDSLKQKNTFNFIGHTILDLNYKQFLK